MVWGRQSLPLCSGKGNNNEGIKYSQQMKNNNISIVHAFQKSGVMAWFRVLIGWRARGGVAGRPRRTPSENEICEVIWGSVSCFHQYGGLHFKCFCVFVLFPLSGCEMNAAENGVTHTIFSIFSYYLAGALPDAETCSFQQWNLKKKSDAVCTFVSTATAFIIKGLDIRG